MDHETAQRVYDCLVFHCHAPDSYRENFVAMLESGNLTEFRFQGALGFGGKYYGDNRVACYPEDMTDLRRIMIDNCNKALKETVG